MVDFGTNRSSAQQGGGCRGVAGAKTRRKDLARQQSRQGPVAPTAKKAPATQRVTRAFRATSNWKLAASPAGTGETSPARTYADG